MLDRSRAQQESGHFSFRNFILIDNIYRKNCQENRLIAPDPQTSPINPHMSVKSSFYEFIKTALSENYSSMTGRCERADLLDISETIHKFTL